MTFPRSSSSFSTLVGGLVAALVAIPGLAACTTTNCGAGGGGGNDSGTASGRDSGVAAVCGNHVCESGESAASCSVDCTTSPPVCGNHVCESGESPATCAADCTTSPPVCGNGACESGESPATCPADCSTPPPVCGNGVCDSGESPSTCPGDCPAMACPLVAGTYAFMPAPVADPSCPAVPVAVTQAGCTVTVSGLFPSPISFTIDASGTGTYTYPGSGGVPAAAAFGFMPGSFVFTDTGLLAFCPGTGTET